jgi:hypothetical protein
LIGYGSSTTCFSLVYLIAVTEFAALVVNHMMSVQYSTAPLSQESQIQAAS